MKYFLIAGEASGDLHASNLMKALLQADPEAQFRFMGGDLMQAVGGERIMHYKETSYMMLDVVLHLGKIFRNMKRLKKELALWQPDVLIPVDYPGFNMRITRFAHRAGLRVFYYISPKVWAWKKGRVKALRAFTSKLFVIFPFEVDWFRKQEMEVAYFGNPLVDEVTGFRDSFGGAEDWRKTHGLDGRPVVALLAGSRKKEIEGMLPAMLQAARHREDHQFVVAGAPGIDADFYKPFLEGRQVKCVYGETYALLASASAAMVTSGTATLETALFRVPQVVMYRTSALAYSIARMLVRIDHISLVNLILKRTLVREVIQKSLAKDAAVELFRILDETSYRGRILDGYEELGRKLGERGVSDRIAGEMVEILKEEL